MGKKRAVRKSVDARLPCQIGRMVVPSPLGIIRCSDVLTTHAFARRLGRPIYWVRMLIRNGLPARKIGNLTFISGRHFRKFIEEAVSE